MEGNPANQQQLSLPPPPLDYPPHSYPPPYGHPQAPPPFAQPQQDQKYIESIQQLNLKLKEIRDEIETLPKNDLEHFKEQKLPLARIKKIMKSDEEVRMISAEAPILFAKACEMFIVEMTCKAYYYATKSNRKTLQRNDIAAAIIDTEIYDFLLDIMPRDEIISNTKDKQLNSYQQQLLDDIYRMTQLQMPPPALPAAMLHPYPGGGGPPPPYMGYVPPPQPPLQMMGPPANMLVEAAPYMQQQLLQQQHPPQGQEQVEEENEEAEEEGSGSGEGPKRRGRKPKNK